MSRLRNWIASKLLGVSQKEVEISRTASQLVNVLRSGDTNLWTEIQPEPPENQNTLAAHRRPPIITIVNFKGGVGKSTLAANLGAYFNKRHVGQEGNFRVLYLDLDYQGSLSASFLHATNTDDPLGNISHWLEDCVAPQNALMASIDLNSLLPGCRIAVADTKLTGLENKLLMRWLLKDTEDDIRFRLARTLWSHQVQSRFDIVIIDAPPRLTTSAIAALCASSHYIVPTVLDRLSTEPIRALLAQLTAIFGDLDVQPRLAGVVASRTWQEDKLMNHQQSARAEVQALLERQDGQPPLFARHIPDLKGIGTVAGTAIPYLTIDALRPNAPTQDVNDAMQVRRIFDDLGEQIAGRLGIGEPQVARLPRERA